MTLITIDNVEYDTKKFGDKETAIYKNILYIEKKLSQKYSSLQISETAKQAYLNAIKQENIKQEQT